MDKPLYTLPLGEITRLSGVCDLNRNTIAKAVKHGKCSVTTANKLEAATKLGPVKMKAIVLLGLGRKR